MLTAQGPSSSSIHARYSLLGLPPELRLTIHKHLFASIEREYPALTTHLKRRHDQQPLPPPPPGSDRTTSMHWGFQNVKDEKLRMKKRAAGLRYLKSAEPHREQLRFLRQFTCIMSVSRITRKESSPLFYRAASCALKDYQARSVQEARSIATAYQNHVVDSFPGWKSSITLSVRREDAIPQILQLPEFKACGITHGDFLAALQDDLALWNARSGCGHCLQISIDKFRGQEVAFITISGLSMEWDYEKPLYECRSWEFQIEGSRRCLYGVY